MVQPLPHLGGFGRRWLDSAVNGYKAAPCRTADFEAFTFAFHLSAGWLLLEDFGRPLWRAKCPVAAVYCILLAHLTLHSR